MTGDRDGYGSGYRWRSLTPSQSVAIARARDAGVSARDLAREYGVGLYTIYRAVRRARQGYTVVRVGDWWAEFALTDEGPIRMTEWLAA